MDQKTPRVTIIIPNYKTLKLTTICLRLLHLYTDLSRIRVIVVDNASNDESLEYLRKVDWIELIERPTTGDEPGFKMHAVALDLAFKQVRTEFVMIMHTDTFICDDKWLDYLLSEISASDRIAAVGSWKLEAVPAWKRIGKRITDSIRAWFKPQKKEVRYLRSHCALYRSDLIRKYTNGFDDGESAGKSMHLMLEKAGFEMKFLESEDLGKYIMHLNHATGIINPPENSRKCKKESVSKELEHRMNVTSFNEMLTRDDLDHAN